LPHARKSQSRSTVLITGATGFLGVHLLHCIIKNTSLKPVCLIRANNAVQAKEKLLSALTKHMLPYEHADNVQIMVGSVSEKYFGMSQYEYEIACSSIDVVVHNAALSNFVYPYEMLRQDNVVGTANVLEFAATTIVKDLYYVSSTGIFGVEKTNGIADEDYQLKITELPRIGYNQTKWAADCIISKAAERGVPAYSLRLGNLCGDSVYGITQNRDFIWMLIKLGVETNCFPHYFQLPFRFSTVDSTADAISRLVRQPLPPGAYHLFGSQLVLYSDILEWTKSFGFQFEIIEFDEWIQRLKIYTAAVRDRAFQSIPMIIDVKEEVDGSFEFIELGNSRTMQMLESVDAQITSLDESIFHKCLQYFVSTGFIKDNRRQKE
jgi:thioester reductase-like protein